MLQFKIEFVEDFKDGTILPGLQRRGTTMVVSEAMYNRMKSSDPSAVMRRGVVIPPPSVVCPDCGVTYPKAEEHTCEEED